MMFETDKAFVEWGCENVGSLIKDGYTKYTFDTKDEFEDFIYENVTEVFKNPENLIFEVKEIGELSHIFYEYGEYSLEWLNISEDSNSVIKVCEWVNGDLTFEYY